MDLSVFLSPATVLAFKRMRTTQDFVPSINSLFVRDLFLVLGKWENHVIYW